MDVAYDLDVIHHGKCWIEGNIEGDYSEVCEDYDEYIRLYRHFWKHNNELKNIYFVNEKIVINEFVYEYDVSKKQDGRVMAYLVKNKEDSKFFDAYLVADGIIYPNDDSSYYFDMPYLETINNLDKLDTSNVSDMSFMFYKAGYYSNKLTLDVSNFDTSKVTDMCGMFMLTGFNSQNFTLDVSNFDTSNVSNMNEMFSRTGYSSEIFTLDVSSFDTSKVTNMSSMFSDAGYNSSNFTLDVSNFDTSNVSDMSEMFSNAGYNSSNFTLDVSNFDTSKVTNMRYMFSGTGYNSTKFILNLSVFDTSKVTDMHGMFLFTGYNNPTFTLDVSNFDTSEVTDMSYMFASTGSNSTKFNTSITIKNSNTSSYYKMFNDVATKPGSKITVNYTSETEELVDKMIATKSTNSNVVKGDLVD